MKKITLNELHKKIKKLSSEIERPEKLIGQGEKKVNDFILIKLKEAGYDDNNQPTQQQYDEICIQYKSEIKKLIESSIITSMQKALS